MSSKPSLKNSGKGFEPGIKIGLSAAIVSLDQDQPQILAVRHQQDQKKGDLNHDALPFGPFSPIDHRTLEIGLHDWVHRQTGLDLGYVEQLYTFGDRGRHARAGDLGPHNMSVGYLALTQNEQLNERSGSLWRSWYSYFPWEDWRAGEPKILSSDILPRLEQWVKSARTQRADAGTGFRAERVAVNFGLASNVWDEERVLERYELLYEAGLIVEAANDGRSSPDQWQDVPPFGRPMLWDHRRILATAMGRLRGKLKYRPVIFELVPELFTLFELQQRVEAISGTKLHKQNFRRLVAATGLVDDTGKLSTTTGGRPARLFRFRRKAALSRAAPGLRVRASRHS